MMALDDETIDDGGRSTHMDGFNTAFVEHIGIHG